MSDWKICVECVFWDYVSVSKSWLFNILYTADDMHWLKIFWNILSCFDDDIIYNVDIYICFCFKHPSQYITYMMITFFKAQSNAHNYFPLNLISKCSRFPRYFWNVQYCSKFSRFFRFSKLRLSLILTQFQKYGYVWLIYWIMITVYTYL